MRHTTARLDYLWLTACSDYFILFFKPINNCNANVGQDVWDFNWAKHSKTTM